MTGGTVAVAALPAAWAAGAGLWKPTPVSGGLPQRVRQVAAERCGRTEGFVAMIGCRIVFFCDIFAA